MRILVVTALFPPDVADPAPYVKELATRLASDNHDVTILTYGKLPEAIAGVAIECVPKNTAVWKRLWYFGRALQKFSKEADVVIVNNAPSTEVPAYFACFFSSARWLLLESDQKIQYRSWRRWLHSKTAKRIPIIPTTLPDPRPEKHPFHPPSEAKWHSYQTSWQQHLSELTKYFPHP